MARGDRGCSPALFAKGGRPGRGSGVGTAAIGSMYEFLNNDKQNAIEIIVEERAEARDPEHKDGNLADLGPDEYHKVLTATAAA